MQESSLKRLKESLAHPLTEEVSGQSNFKLLQLEPSFANLYMVINAGLQGVVTLLSGVIKNKKIAYQSPRSNRIKPDKCRKCGYFEFCDGVSEKYIKLYDWAEFIPYLITS